MLFNPLDAVDNALGVAVGGVDNNHVDAGVYQTLHAILALLAHAHRGADPQTPVLVLCGIGEIGRFLDVLYRDQALETEFLVHHQDLFDPVFMEKSFDFFAGSALLDGHKPFFRRHDTANRLVVACLEAQVAGRDNSHQVVAIGHRHPGNVVCTRQFQDFADARVGSRRDRVLDDAGLEFLYPADLVGLFFGGHVLMHDADATLLCKANGGARLGHGIHGRGQQRDV